MKYSNISPEEFNELRKKERYVVLDVRTPAEVAEEAIPGHVAINLFDPAFRTKIENLDKSKHYLVYCRSGNRSANACTLMANLGFKNLYNLAGGIGVWRSAKVA
ncbi:rhodanese-like domain-containing protein [Catalinimonas sp. 4WD22]|uniref:rhodanese-like domain-containing protein n=1 Tax=Catalinimonas locisalis TaxID=3133978 RepID=UPI003101824A